MRLRPALTVLVVLLCLAGRPTGAEAHNPTWPDVYNTVWYSNWGGLCGQGANWVCKRRYAFEWTWTTGAHSRWVAGSFWESPYVPPWGSWRWCRVQTRFYHGELAEVSYKHCS